MRLSIFIAFVFTALAAIAQPKLTIQEDILRDAVIKAQEEGETRFLSNLVQKSIKTTNYTTYNTLYDCVDILLRQSDKSVMKKKLVRSMADYGMCFAVTKVISSRLKRGAEKLNAPTDTAGFIVAAQDLEDVLLRSYAVQKGKETLNPKELNGDTLRVDSSRVKVVDHSIGYWAGLDNFLMDTVYQILANSKTLQGCGLFADRGTRRNWQYGLLPINYKAFWKEHPTEREAMLTQVGRLKDNLASLDSITQEAALLMGVQQFKLSSLKLDELSFSDKESVKVAVGLFDLAAKHFAKYARQNAVIQKIAEVIVDHVIFDSGLEEGSPNKFAIDVEGMILSFEDRFLGWNESPMKNSFFNLRPFFTIGLNYGYFGGPDTAFAVESSLGQRQIAWAGEKVGLKWRLHDWGYTRSREAHVPYKYKGRYITRFVRPRIPLVSNVYWMLYGSGVLYTIADLRSDSEFNQIIIGSGGGIQLFNKLEINLSYALRVDSKSLDQGFVNVGFDIPIFSYIRAVRANGN